eukprot:3584453-Ditylum_brightwellii.AAC.2
MNFILQNASNPIKKILPCPGAPNDQIYLHTVGPPLQQMGVNGDGDELSCQLYPSPTTQPSPPGPTY